MEERKAKRCSSFKINFGSKLSRTLSTDGKRALLLRRPCWIRTNELQASVCQASKFTSEGIFVVKQKRGQHLLSLLLTTDLISAIEPKNPFKKTHWLRDDGTGSANNMLTDFRVLGLIPAPLYSFRPQWTLTAWPHDGIAPTVRHRGNVYRTYVSSGYK